MTGGTEAAGRGPEATPTGVETLSESEQRGRGSRDRGKKSVVDLTRKVLYSILREVLD